MVRKVIVPAQDHADFPYLVPDGIPAWQREHGAVHVGGIVQGQYLLGYRVQGDERFHPGLLPVDADEPPPLRRRPDMARMELLDVGIGKPGEIRKKHLSKGDRNEENQTQPVVNKRFCSCLPLQPNSRERQDNARFPLPSHYLFRYLPEA